MEIHGTDKNDHIAYGGDTNDTLMGYGGDDILAGGPGKDTITGGAGADNLTGSTYNEDTDSMRGDDVDDDADTFVYTAISDSQITGFTFTDSRFATLTDINTYHTPQGTDRIFGFDTRKTGEKIDLSALSLKAQGDLLFYNAGDGTQKLYDYLYDEGDLTKGNFEGLFRGRVGSEDQSGTKYKEIEKDTLHLNTIAIVRTLEAYIGDIETTLPTLSYRSDGKKLNYQRKVYWVLVDVNENGDFDREADMAIAVISGEGSNVGNDIDMLNSSPITLDNFIF